MSSTHKNQKIRLFEFEDQIWFPNVIRSGMTDFLRYLIRLLNVYKPVTPLLLEVLHQTNQQHIVDLGSGGGGAIEQIYRNVNLQSASEITITLSDKFPNPAAWQYIKQKTHGAIGHCANPVDANAVPASLNGVRTLFSAAHHFNPKQLTQILASAVSGKNGICLFDGGSKSIGMLLGAIVFQPLLFLVLTPFFRPFKISRLLLTYLLPVIPFCTVWDGCVSLSKLYSPQEFLQMAASASAENYIWKAGRVKNKLGLQVAYLIGYPVLN